jgi:hypothetical protein
MAGTLHEDIHPFLCIKVTGLGIPMPAWLPWLLWLAYLPVDTQTTVTSSLMPFTKVKFWWTHHNCCIIHPFSRLFCPKEIFFCSFNVTIVKNLVLEVLCPSSPHIIFWFIHTKRNIFYLYHSFLKCSVKVISPPPPTIFHHGNLQYFLNFSGHFTSDKYLCCNLEEVINFVCCFHKHCSLLPIKKLHLGGSVHNSDTFDWYASYRWRCRITSSCISL